MFLTLLLSLTLNAPTQAPVVQDTLPALHTLKDQDIASVTKNDYDTITVILTGGKVYKYSHADWDLEDRYPDASKKIKEAIRFDSKTFTKVEQEPEFPGGDEAWQKYVDSFCVVHKKEIRKAGSAEVQVQFIVHMKGQLTDVQVITTSTPVDKRQADLAVQVLKESPAWLPAVQNGRNVVCYAKQYVYLH